VNYGIDTILNFLVIGLAVGCIYGLVAMGLCVIYNASGIVNFAQGAFVMFGGMAAYAIFAMLGLPMVVAGPLAVIAAWGLGWVVMRSVIGPLLQRRAPVFIMILATMAVQIVLENGAMHVIGTKPVTLPEITPGWLLRIGGVVVGGQSIWIAVGTLVVGILLWGFFTRTIQGKAMRACAVNSELASLLGIPVDRMVMLSFAISAALGAVGGVLITPSQYTAFNVALPFSIKGFTAAIVGGFGNVAGALAGGLVIGMLESLSVAYLSSGYKDVIVFAFLIVMLIVRPSGLFSSPGVH
jgi:branched-chain amino acid transport system permease protein